MALRRSAVNEFNVKLEEWTHDPRIFEKSEEMTRQFNQLLAQLKAQFPVKYPAFDDFQVKFDKFLRLVESRHCLAIAKDVRDAAVKVNSALPAQFDTALEIQTSLLPREAELHKLKHSTTANANVALKTLQFFQVNIRNKLQAHLDGELKKLFEKAGWPNSIVAPTYYEEFTALFVKYLDVENEIKTPSKFPTPLEAFKALLAPIDLRFQYHFEGNASTNKPDKPEWAFHHFINIVDTHADFLTGPVTKALKQSARFSDRNGVYEFIVAFLPSIRRKMFSLFLEVADSPQLLSHLVYEAVMFDNALKEKYYFLPYGRQSWRGISGDLLSNEDWFQKWQAVENASAIERYEEIIDSTDAFELDFDSVDSNETKPTESAINLKDLLETITEHYASLTSVKFRLRYFLTVQVNLLDKYYARLLESIDAFDNMSSTFTRAVGGVSAENLKLVTGMNGLERLCRIFGSLNYISLCLEQWGDDEVCIDPFNFFRNYTYKF